MTATSVKQHVASLQPHEEQRDTAPGSTSDELPARAPKSRGRRWVLVAAVAAVALAGAAGGWRMHSNRGTTGEANDSSPNGSSGRKAALGFAEGGDAASDNGRTSRGETIRVEMVPRHSRLGLTGTLVADEQSSVASNTNGIVAQVRVDRGSVVKKGDVLVQLDSTDAKNRLAEGMALADELKARLTWGDASGPFVAEDQPAVKLAAAALALATSRKNRAEALAQKNAISADEGEQHKSEYECAVQRHRQSLQQVRQDYQAYQTAVAKLAALRKAVADTTIVAPFDGMVVEKNVAVGEHISGGGAAPASKVVTMARINPLRVCVTVPQQSSAQIAPGQTLHFRADSHPGKTFRAEVRYVSPEVTSDTRSLLVEAVADNANGALRPGLFITAELELSQQEPEMLVPVAAVQRTGEVARVVVVRDGVARGQVVALGEENNGKVRIQSGLTGKEVLLSRPELFRDGDQVR